MRIALLLLAALAAAPASAEKAAGSQSDAEAVRRLHALGLCVAQMRPAQAHALVVDDHRSKAYAKQIKAIQAAHDDCPDRVKNIRSSGLLYAGAIAEGLLHHHSVVGRLADATAHDPSRPNIHAASAGDFFAYCVVRQDPASVAALFATPSSSAAEFDAIRTLQPTMSRCAPKGSEAEFTREALRALLALNSYRLYAHNGGTAEGALN